jgi:hypothetical protein
MASITAHPQAPGTLLFSNPHSLQRDAKGREVPGGRGRRENLSIKLSRDSGRTWTINKTLEAGPSAYSDLAVMPNGTVICFYERDTRLSIARFNLEWLTGGSPKAPETSLLPGADSKPAVNQTGDPPGKDAWLAQGFTEEYATDHFIAQSVFPGSDNRRASRCCRCGEPAQCSAYCFRG